MATTPRPYLWEFCTKRADVVDGLGGMAHYFTEDAQSFYLHNGISAKNMVVDDGQWDDATASEEVNFETNHFTQMSLTHPSTGSWYATVILPAEEYDSVYLVRYTYSKDIGHLVSSAKWGLQVDNPISQLSASIKNYDSDAFTKPASLFVPGARAELGLTMGDSQVYKLGIVHLDEIDFKYNSTSVPISGRNTTGYVLNDSTFNASGKKEGTVKSVIKWVLDYFGIDKYEIEDNSTSFSLEYEPNMTGLRALQDICDRVSGFENGTDWDIEETWDGTIVIGFNSFRAQYLPKQVFKFGRGELFKRSSNKVIDGAYSKIYCTGKDSNGHDLTPVCLNVTTWKWWNVVPNKTYFTPVLENTTQEELAKYAAAMAKQIKRTGLTESYQSTIKPQLLVGDYATVTEGETETDIGIITQINHTLSERGYMTEFVADSGGDKQALLTRSSNEGVYTSARRNSGDNRNKRLIDFIRNTAQQAVRTSGASGGSGGSVSGVEDVLVDGTSVVSDNVANIDLTGKQNVLTTGDRITITSDVISSDIAPFSIVDGKMCITYKGET